MQDTLDALEQGATLVTGSARLARHVQWHYSRRRRDRGASCWQTPDVLHWEAWLERLWQQAVMREAPSGAVDLASPEQVRFAWRASREHAGAQGVRESPASRHLIDSAWRLCVQWRIPLDAIGRGAATADTEFFLRRAHWFEHYCRDHRLIDPARLPDALADDIAARRLDVAGSLLFSGFEVRTPQHRRFEAALEQAGVRVRRVSGGASRATPSVVEFENPAAEIDCAARCTRHAIERDGVRSFGILLADEQAYNDPLRRRFLDILAPDWRNTDPDRWPVNAFERRALADYAPVRVALLVLHALDGRMDYRDLGQLLRSGYLSDGLSEAGPRAALDLHLRERSQRTVGLRRVAARAAAHAPQFADLLNRIGQAAAALPARQDCTGWAADFDKLLAAVGWPGEAALTSAEFQAVAAWQRLLLSLGDLGRVCGPVDVRDARRHLEEMAGDQLFQPEGPAGGVQVIRLADAMDHRFERIWVPGAAAEAWPPVRRPNPLIPLALQREAGIPNATPAGIAELGRRAFDRLMTMADEVVVSWARQHDQETRLASPMLRDLNRRAAAELERSDVDDYRTVIRRASQLETLDADPPPALRPDETYSGGSRVLALQSACPARAFFECRLGAAELPVPAFGIDPLTRGNLLHMALENVYRRAAERGGLQRMDENALRALMAESVEAAIARHAPGQHAFAGRVAELERRRALGLLAAVVDRDRAREAFEIEAVERRVDVRIGPLPLVLRHDRVDRAADGSLLVIDYKTGRGFSPRAWSGPRPAEPQLPLYAVTSPSVRGIAVMLVNQEGVNVIGVGEEDFGLGLKPVDSLKEEGAGSWEDLVARWEERLAALAGEFAAGDVRFDSMAAEPATGDFAMLVRIHDRGSVPPEVDR